MKVNDTTKGNLEMILAMMLSGTIGYFVVHSGQSFWNVVFFRCVIGGGLLLAYAFYRGVLPEALKQRSMLLLVLLGGVTLVANWVFLFASFSYIPFSIATVAYHTQPLMLVLAGAVLARQAPTGSLIFWLIVSFTGLWFVIELDMAEVRGLLQGDTSSVEAIFGLGLALAAALLYTVTTLITKQVSSVPPYLVALIQMGVGVLMLLPFVQWGALPSSSASWLDLFILGAINTSFMYIIMYDAFQKLPTNLLAILSFIYPITALFVDHIAFATHISAWQLVGVALILISVCAVKFDWSLPKLGRRSAKEGIS